MDRLRPPRPALTFGEKGLALTHTPPTYASHVALYLYDADGRKRFLDADKNELLCDDRAPRDGQPPRRRRH